MQVVRHLTEGETELGDLFLGEGKQGSVVALEVDLSSHGQHLAVKPQEVAVGQPALGLIALGPGIAEVDVDAAYFAAFKELRQLIDVSLDKKDVAQFFTRRAFHRHHQRVRHTLDRQEQHVRFVRRGLGGESALAAAKLHADLAAVGHQFAPVPLALVGVLDLVGTAPLHAGDQVFLFAHAHGNILAFRVVSADGGTNARAFADTIIANHTEKCKST